MIKLTAEQFETIKRQQDPEVYTSDQMSAWIEGSKEILIKAEVDELNELEKAEVDLFNEEFKSFVKVTVISSPEENELSKSLKYTDFYIREKQVDWVEVDSIIKSEDGAEEIEKGREGTYTNTALNQKMGRVGAKYGQHSAKKDEDDSGESKEGSDFDKFDKIVIQASAGHNYSTSAGSVNVTDKSVKSLKDAKDKINEELKSGREKGFSYNKVKVTVRGWIMGKGFTDLGEFKMGISEK